MDNKTHLNNLKDFFMTIDIDFKHKNHGVNLY